MTTMSFNDAWEVAVEPTQPDTYEASAQRMISNGQGWLFEGSVGRGLMGLIESGVCVLGPVATRDYWGSRIPSRYDVVPGTTGSIEYANAQREERGDDLLTEEGVAEVEARS
jgi:hypothetical protein